MISESSIRAQGQAIVSSVECRPPQASSSCLRSCKHYQVRGPSAKKEIGNLDDEVAKLQKVSADLKRFNEESDQFKQSCQMKLRELSIFKPSTWKSLLAESIDRLIIFLFGPLIAFGTYRVGMARVDETREQVVDALTEMKRLSLDALKAHKSIKVLDVLSELGKLDDTDKSHLEAVGERMLYEGAYSYAVQALDTYTKTHPENVRASGLLASALKSARQFDQALNVIQNRPEFELVRIDCLIGKGALDEAKTRLRRIEPKSQEVIKKLFEVTQSDLNECFAIYSQLDEARAQILTSSSDEVKADFWLARINLDQKSELIDGLIDAAKSLAKQAVISRVQNAILKLQVPVQESVTDADMQKALSSAYEQSMRAFTSKKEALELVLSKLAS